MLGSDPPAHTRLRGLVNKAFTPRMIQRLEPRMHEIANELLDAALEQGDVDLVQALSYPLPVTVIAEIIGIPAEDRAKFKRWSDEAVANLGLVFVGGFDPERAQRQLQLFDAMREYFIPLAEERRRQPARGPAHGPGAGRARGLEARFRGDAVDARAAARRGQRDHHHADRQRRRSSCSPTPAS